VFSSEIGLHVHKIDHSPANSRFYETVWKTLGMIENRDDLCLGESTFFHSGIWSDPYNLSALFMPCRAIGEVDTSNHDPTQRASHLVFSARLFLAIPFAALLAGSS
jgi:hypothetical protein